MRRVALILLLCSLLAQTGRAQSAGDVIISEIMYAPDGADTDREYVEVYNASASQVNLKGWTLVGEDPATSNPQRDEIDADLVLDSGEFALLCENPDPADNGGLECDFDYVNDIDHTNEADYVVLKASGTEIDRIHYDETGNWPEAVGASIEFTGGEGDDNNRASNWQEASARTGDFADSGGPNDGSPGANAPGGALPVELAFFDAHVSDDHARLTWKTSAETNNAGFAVQHRASGAGEWSKLGFVQGEGTTSRPQRYRFATDALAPGTHAFRLRQVDTDGTAHLSAPRRVEVTGEDGLRLVGANPVTRGERAVVSVQADPPGRVEVALYNVLGERIRTLTPTIRAKRTRRVQIPASALSSGTYFVRVEGPSIDDTVRFTVVR
jgi:hypothetical protein